MRWMPEIMSSLSRRAFVVGELVGYGCPCPAGLLSVKPAGNDTILTNHCAQQCQRDGMLPNAQASLQYGAVYFVEMSRKGIVVGRFSHMGKVVRRIGSQADVVPGVHDYHTLAYSRFTALSQPSSPKACFLSPKDNGREPTKHHNLVNSSLGNMYNARPEGVSCDCLPHGLGLKEPCLSNLVGVVVVDVVVPAAASD